MTRSTTPSAAKAPFRLGALQITAELNPHLSILVALVAFDLDEAAASLGIDVARASVSASIFLPYVSKAFSAQPKKSSKTSAPLDFTDAYLSIPAFHRQTLEVALMSASRPHGLESTLSFSQPLLTPSILIETDAPVLCLRFPRGPRLESSIRACSRALGPSAHVFMTPRRLNTEPNMDPVLDAPPSKRFSIPNQAGFGIEEFFLRWRSDARASVMESREKAQLRALLDSSSNFYEFSHFFTW